MKYHPAMTRMKQQMVDRDDRYDSVELQVQTLSSKDERFLQERVDRSLFEGLYFDNVLRGSEHTTIGFYTGTLWSRSRVNDAVAYLVLTHTEDLLGVVWFVVRKDLRRQNFGKSILKWVIEQSKRLYCSKIMFPCAENRLDTQLFLKACGFRCIKIKTYDQLDQPYYIFEYRVGEGVQIAAEEKICSTKEG